MYKFVAKPFFGGYIPMWPTTRLVLSVPVNNIISPRFASLSVISFGTCVKFIEDRENAEVIENAPQIPNNQNLYGGRLIQICMDMQGFCKPTNSSPLFISMNSF